jgi:hypothetical protein
MTQFAHLRSFAKLSTVCNLALAVSTLAGPAAAMCELYVEVGFNGNMTTCFQEGENGTARAVEQNGVRAIFVSLQQDGFDEDLAQVQGIRADGSAQDECRAWTFDTEPAVAGDPDRVTNLQGNREGPDLNGDIIQFDGSCNDSVDYALVVYNPEVPQD